MVRLEKPAAGVGGTHRAVLLRHGEPDEPSEIRFVGPECDEPGCRCPATGPADRYDAGDVLDRHRRILDE